MRICLCSHTLFFMIHTVREQTHFLQANVANGSEQKTSLIHDHTAKPVGRASEIEHARAIQFSFVYYINRETCCSVF